MKFSTIHIIYNPISTGDSEGRARALYKKLAVKMPAVPVTLLPTEYAGHAEELAYQTARTHHNPLLVSSSGDGGYHEVVNGALRAQDTGSRPVCAVLPSGNANDHARSMHQAPLETLILSGKISQLDVLKVVATSKSAKTEERYAHGYIGFGLTPVVAEELNAHALNKFIEGWYVIKGFIKLRPVRLVVDGKKMQLDSLVCSNIPFMAKYLTVSKQAKPDDGRFELVLQRHRWALAGLLLHIFRGAVTEMGASRQCRELTIKVLQNTTMQLDGELQPVPKGAQLHITCQKQTLRTIV